MTMDAVLAIGSLLLAGMLAFLLRRREDLVTLEDEGVSLAGRLVAWTHLQRFGLARGARGSWFRLFTPEGVLGFRDDQVLEHPESVAARIVARAGLVPAEPLLVPRGAFVQPGDRYLEWAPPGAAAAAVEPARAGPVAGSGDVAEAGRKAAVGLGALLAVLWKFGKVVLVALEGVARSLQLGTILPTLLSMLVSVWAYALLWTWRFALGFVVLVFLHELGHALVIRAKGLRTSPIVFVPFFGAFIGIKDQFRDAAVEAETAYGGPAAGALAASACFVAFRGTGEPFWLHLAYVGFLLNLFNLIPVSPMDGGRIVTAISPWLWIVGLVLAGVLAVAWGHPILVLIVLLGALRAWHSWRQRRSKGAAAYFDLPAGYRALMTLAYFGLCAYLALMTAHAFELAYPDT